MIGSRGSTRGGGKCNSIALYNLAEVYRDQRRYEDAEEALRESLRLRRTHAPHMRMELALTINTLATLLHYQGKQDEANPMLLETVRAWREALPPRSSLDLKVSMNVASVFMQQKELDIAEKLLRETIQSHRTPDKPPSAPLETAVVRLGWIVREKDDGTPEYDQVRTKFIEYARGVLGNESAALGVLLAEEICCPEGRGKLVEALAMAGEALKLLRRDAVHKEGAKQTEEDIRRLAWIVARSPDHEVKEYETAIEAAGICFGDDPEEWDPADTNTMGVLQYRLRRYDEALATLDPPEKDPARLAFAAMAQHRLGRKEEAKASLIRLREILQGAADGESQTFLDEAESTIQ